MSSDVLLQAKGIYKTYSSSNHPFAILMHALFGKKLDPKDAFPVLKDIDLTIRKGETIGIMGKNGAGKTTLLGILGNVIEPTAGKVIRNGRIATLLGLTAGFNPNFSGRENAYLFCSIQGLSKAEIDEKIDDIEIFAELGKYFELPLRNYSSGMQSRLAFSCAVHVNADLIIIDETLAVGDANFRMKCYDRIREMKDAGQTFLLVSHNQNLVANFCTRGVIINDGRKVFDGPTFEAVEEYKAIRTEELAGKEINAKQLKNSSYKKNTKNNVVLENFKLSKISNKEIPLISIECDLKVNREVEQVTINFGLTNHHGIVVCSWDGAMAGKAITRLKDGEHKNVRMTFHNRLLPGRYYVSCIVNQLIGDIKKPLSIYQNILSFDVGGGNIMTGIADLGMDIVIV